MPKSQEANTRGASLKVLASGRKDQAKRFVEGHRANQRQSQDKITGFLIPNLTPQAAVTQYVGEPRHCTAEGGGREPGSIPLPAAAWDLGRFALKNGLLGVGDLGLNSSALGNH